MTITCDSCRSFSLSKAIAKSLLFLLLLDVRERKSGKIANAIVGRAINIKIAIEEEATNQCTKWINTIKERSQERHF